MPDLNAAIKVRANAVMSTFNIVPGQLTADQKGLNFQAAGPGFISIDWSGVEKISAQIILGFYWRGIFVQTNQGEFQFITTRTRKLVKVISQFVDRDKIVRRQSVFGRKK